MRLLTIAMILLTNVAAAQAAEVKVVTSMVEDQKAVLATVEPVRQLVARTRIGGTIVSLKVREGDLVQAGDQIAMVADQKIALQMLAIDQRIRSQQALRDQARTDFDRVQELLRRGVSAQVQLDQARTALDIAERTLAAIQADRSVIEQQMSEGAVLAPGAGRVLSVPVSEGRVTLPGESVATLAEDRYILRLSLPERHAQFMRAGDKVLISERGLAVDAADTRREGQVRLVYPEIQGGRVIADVDVINLGNYFVGERTRVYVTTGRRPAMVLPAVSIYQRAGVSFVRLKGGAEVAIQVGETRPEGTEVLAGLRDGDVVILP